MKKRPGFLIFPLEENLWEYGLEISKKALNSDFSRKVVETFATRVTLIGLGLLTSIVVARILGPERRGIFSVAMTLGAIATQFGNIGLHVSNTFLVARNPRTLPALVGNSLAVGMGAGLFLALTIWVVFTFRPSLALLQGNILFLALIWIPLSLTYLFFQNLLIGIQDIRSFNKIELTGKILSLSLIGLLIFVGSVTVAAVFITNLIILVFSLIWSFNRLRSASERILRFSVKLFTENISYGFKAYVVALFSFLVIRIDLLMVQYYKGFEQAGYYSIAANMGELIYTLPMVVASILFPKLSGMPRLESKWRLARKTSWVVAGFLAISTIVSIWVGRWMILLLYGKSYLPSVDSFLWLLPGVFFLGVQTVLVQFLNSLGFPKVILWGWGAVTLLNIGMNLWFIPQWGIIGASFSSSICYFLIFCFVLLTIRRTLREKSFSSDR